MLKLQGCVLTMINRRYKSWRIRYENREYFLGPGRLTESCGELELIASVLGYRILIAPVPCTIYANSIEYVMGKIHTREIHSHQEFRELPECSDCVGSGCQVRPCCECGHVDVKICTKCGGLGCIL